MDPESLLLRARSGDRQAWNDLLEWSRPFIRALLCRQVGSPEDASELTNDVQVRMHKGFDRFLGVARGQFLAWARKIAARVLCDHRQRHQMPMASLTIDPASPRSDISSSLNRDEEMVRLARALEQLPHDQRIVIEARLFSGLPPHVIAQRLNWPAGRVRVYALRAVEFLAARLRGES